MLDNLLSKNVKKTGFGEPFHPDKEFVYKFKGGLEVKKTGDGHKRPMIGGPTKGWINISATYKGKKKYISLYAEGTQGKPEMEYPEVKWKCFFFAQAGEGNIVVRREKK